MIIFQSDTSIEPVVPSFGCSHKDFIVDCIWVRYEFSQHIFMHVKPASFSVSRAVVLLSVIWMIFGLPGPGIGADTPLPPILDTHISHIASFAKPSPQVTIPGGWFLMGT